MSERITPEDGQPFINFLQRWGTLPSGELCMSCELCGFIVGHVPSCKRHAGGPRSYIVMRGDRAIRYYMPEDLGPLDNQVRQRGL